MMIHQPFDADGRLLCLSCRKHIEHEDLYVEIRQRDIYDEDSRLAIHTRCFSGWDMTLEVVT